MIYKDNFCKIKIHKHFKTYNNIQIINKHNNYNKEKLKLMNKIKKKTMLAEKMVFKIYDFEY